MSGWLRFIRRFKPLIYYKQFNFTAKFSHSKMNYKDISKITALEPAQKLLLKGDNDANKSANHVLLMDETRRFPTVADYVKHRELAAGNAQSEQLALEIYTANQINRGPPGAFSATNVHQELLTGMDDRIGLGFLTDDEK